MTPRPSVFGSWLPVALGAILLLSAGCSYQPRMEREQLERGYVMLLTGVECYGSYHVDVVHGLRDGGVDRAIEIVEWGSHPFGTFKNLYNYPGNREIAARLSTKIVEYSGKYPSRPVTILGYSGGGAMALWLAESLPAGFTVDRIILTAPAISPTYDVRAALAHTRGGMINFYSNEDWFMAGLATEWWGTMDRVKTASAGKLGFRDALGRLQSIAGFTQAAWIKGWGRLGNDGSHSGWRSRRWAAEVLAPAILHATTETLAE